jgi:hypothetical protein
MRPRLFDDLGAAKPGVTFCEGPIDEGSSLAAVSALLHRLDRGRPCPRQSPTLIGDHHGEEPPGAIISAAGGAEMPVLVATSRTRRRAQRFIAGTRVGVNPARHGSTFNHTGSRGC